MHSFALPTPCVRNRSVCALSSTVRKGAVEIQERKEGPPGASRVGHAAGVRDDRREDPAPLGTVEPSLLSSARILLAA